MKVWQAMTAIVTILCLKFCLDKGFWPTFYIVATQKYSLQKEVIDVQVIR